MLDYHYPDRPSAVGVSHARTSDYTQRDFMFSTIEVTGIFPPSSFRWLGLSTPILVYLGADIQLRDHNIGFVEVAGNRRRDDDSATSVRQSGSRTSNCARAI